MGTGKSVPSYVEKLKSFGLEDDQILAFLSSLAPFIQDEVQRVFSELLPIEQMIALQDVAKENYLDETEFYILLEEAYKNKTEGKELNDLVDKLIQEKVDSISTQVDKFIDGLNAIKSIQEESEAEKALENLLVSIIE